MTSQLNMETWKPVDGYEGLYEVSDHGRVKNSKTGKVLTPYVVRNGWCMNSNEYARVGLRKDGERKNLRVHVLVAKAFLVNPQDGIFDLVNHKDEDTSNNHVSNLEWCDAKYNVRYSSHKRKGTTIERVLNFKKERIVIWKNGTQLGKFCSMGDIHAQGFRPDGVRACLRNDSKTHRGCTFSREVFA